MRLLIHAFVLAMSDYWHERLLSACSVLGLAAVLAPLMVLLGVHNGIITAMTNRLLNDPRTMEITPVGSGKYGSEWFRELESLPGVAFVLPQTRSIAATMTLRNPGREGFFQAVTPLMASGKGDPLLLRWRQPEVGWNAGTWPETPTDADAEDDGPPIASVVLSESSARKLAVGPGNLVEGRLDRVRNGRRESAGLRLRVLSVLPPEVQTTDMMYVPLELLVATEDYRDGKAVPFLGWAGDARQPSPDDGTDRHSEAARVVYAERIRQDREYASFRLYAKSLDDVSPLWRFFQERKIEVYVKAEEIDTVKSLDKAFAIVFGLITGAAIFGFSASTASSALAGVKRKSRSLGIMRLIGFPRSGMLLFPVAQTMTTGVLGSVLAFVLYLGVALSIDTLFSASLPGGEAVCSLSPAHLAGVFGVVALLSSLSSLVAAWQATTIEPSEVIRDV